ncbi:MAG: peptidyl-prolyl cis-trans isomerase [Planctomycetes bacterium]|nr:peptidyl-prolyl cis-trans isomerase [Planctomycetota bacterium]
MLAVCFCLGGCRKSAPDDQTGNGTGNGEPPKVIDIKPPVTPDDPGRTPTTPPTPTPIKSAPVQVLIETSEGDIVLELDKTAAPVTVVNFVRYVNEGFYDGTIFHRVMPGFMIQGGGYTPKMTEKATHSPIINEAANGLKNTRGTIAMARTNMPHSATSQFFINHGNNAGLDYSTGRDPNGYAVFGKVIKGMDVVDAIAAGETVVQNGEKSLPVKPVVIKKAAVISAE